MKLILVTVLVFSGIISANAADITIKITSKYLNLPVSQKEDRKVMRFEMDGKEERAFKIRLADEPEYWGNPVAAGAITVNLAKSLLVQYDYFAAILDCR